MRNKAVKDLVLNPVRKHIPMAWWNETLYSLCTKKLDLGANVRRTLYQQRWAAKQELRAYHGPNVMERQLIDRHFTLNLKQQWMKPRDLERMPNAAVLGFARLERRLDVVVFRSHFAESIFKAAQIIRKGRVKVNGQVSTFAGQELQDGDMVTVDPNMVPMLKQTNDGYKFHYYPNMAPFMFIPEYLEVNYPTCSTIFLREPMPQPGRMEVPSPFPVEMHEMAFAYYSRMRRVNPNYRDFTPVRSAGKTLRLKRFATNLMKRDQETLRLEKEGIKLEPVGPEKYIGVRRKIVRTRPVRKSRRKRLRKARVARMKL
jgi:ribosomal protein S4